MRNSLRLKNTERTVVDTRDMGLLDNIGNNAVSHTEYGRLTNNSTSERVEFTHLMYLLNHIKSKDSPYDLWFEFLFCEDEISDHSYDELLDVLATIKNIKTISPIYLIPKYLVPKIHGGTYGSIMAFGITYNIRSLRDVLKLIWEVSSAIWGTCFSGDTRHIVSVLWKNNLGKVLEMKVEFSKFLKTFRNFDAYRHHNCLTLNPEQRDASIIWHLIRRPISQEEAEKSNKWCRNYYENIVRKYSLKI